MTIDIFVLKGDLNGENRSGAFLFLSGIGIMCILLNQICNVATFRKKILSFDMFHIYCSSVCIQSFVKILTTDLSLNI